MARIGIYGGSFNPIHNGHVEVAKSVIDSGLVDEVWMMVSPLNPFKKHEADSIAPFDDRYNMAMMACNDVPHVYFSKIYVSAFQEENCPQPSYTIDLLRALRDEYKKDTFLLIMGSDNWETFPKWNSYKEIMTMCDVIVVGRPQHRLNVNEFPPKVHFVEGPNLDYSSTEIRRLISHGILPHNMIHPEVKKYIMDEQLYGQSKQDEILDRLSHFFEYAHQTLATAESCTGGMISKTITDLAGVSAFFKGSIVSYATEVKENLLGVQKETLEKYTVNSLEVAKEMAIGAKKLLGTNYAVAVTGLAGPATGDEKQDVGNIYVYVCGNKFENGLGLHTKVNDRTSNRKWTTYMALTLLDELVAKEADRGMI